MQMMIFISDTSTGFVVAPAARLTHSELFFENTYYDLEPGLTHRRQCHEPLSRRKGAAP
jgi:hypothetical protein